MRYRLADVRASYDAQKAREEWYGDWMSAAVYRPLSFYLTVPLLNLSVTASQVTLAGLLMALALPLLALFAGPYAHLGVAVLAIGFVILDCVDGNIARVTHSASKTGHYLDFFTDIVFRITLYAATGLLADREMAGLLGGEGLALGLLAALLAIVGRLSRVFTRQLSPGDVFDPVEEGAPQSVIDRFVLPALSGLDRLVPILVFAAQWTGGLGWVILWLVVYSAGDLIYTQYAVFRRLASA